MPSTILQPIKPFNFLNSTHVDEMNELFLNIKHLNKDILQNTT